MFRSRQSSSSGSIKNFLFSTSVDSNQGSSKNLAFQTSVESNKSIVFEESTELNRGIESSDFEEWAVLNIVEVDEDPDLKLTDLDTDLDADLEFDGEQNECVQEDENEEMDPLKVVPLESMEYKFSDGVKVQVAKSPDSGDEKPKVSQQRSIDEANLMSDHISKNLQKERQLLQEKMYISWFNYRLQQAPGTRMITNLCEDLKDGTLLLSLLELLTGKKLKAQNGKMRVHHLTNLAKAFKVLEEEGIKTIGIQTESICDGNVIPTLGLCWIIIYHFQVMATVDVEENQTAGDVEKALLEWCKNIAKSYASSDVKNFQPNRWKTGYMLNAIIHSFNPKLFQYHTLTQFSDNARVQHALDVALEHYKVPQLFSASDIEQNLIDNKTLVLYVSMLREKMAEQQDTEKQIMEKLLAYLVQLKKAVDEKEKSDILKPPSNQTFSESKGLSGQFKGFDKELDELSAKVGKIKEDSKSADHTDDTEQLNVDCDSLLERIKKLKETSTTVHENLKQGRVKSVRDKLDGVIKDVAAIKFEMEELSANISPDTSKEDLLKYESSCKNFSQKLAQMQSVIKGTCTLVDEAYADKSLPKEARQTLKNDAIKLLDEYAKLMGVLEGEQDRAKKLLDKNVKSTEDQFSSWKDKVAELDVWLGERINKYENMLVEYGTLAHLKDVSSKNKHLIKEIGESWRKFEGLAAEWNTDLCDKLNDDKYADVLTDIQLKFNKLNEVATKVKSLISGMAHQKRAEDDLCTKILSLKTYADTKEKEINSENDTAKLELIAKEVDGKDAQVKSLLKSAIDTLKKNKYDENAVKLIETDIKVFCDQWDRLKVVLKDTKLRIENLEQTKLIQRESERNLVESLTDWQKTLDHYLSELNDSDINSTNLDEIEKAISKVEALVFEIEGLDAKIMEYDRNSTTLINTLENENASRLNIDFQLFFKNWEKLKDRSHSVLDRLKEQHAKIHADEENLMGEWRQKHQVTEEWIDNVTQEIAVYAEAEMNFDDFDGYLDKFDELENKVNDGTEIVDGSIQLGKSLSEGDQLILDRNKATIKEVVDAFQQKKTNIHDNLQLAKLKMGQLKEKRRLEKENEEMLAANLAAWNKTLADNTETLDQCDVKEIHNLSDTQKAIDTLETLLNDILCDDDKLNDFDINCQVLLDTISNEKAAAFDVELKLFQKSWDHCKDKTDERLNGLKMQYSQLLKSEEYLLSDWDSNARKTIAWLEDTEKSSATLRALPDDLNDIQAYLRSYEELVNKVNDKESDIAEQKSHGIDLLDNVQQEKNVEKIQGHLKAFEEKLEVVHGNLSTAKKLIEEHVRDMILKKLADFEAWLPAIRKRSEEGPEIGPDFETVSKQIQEMRVIESQAIQMAFSGVLEDKNILPFLTDEDKESLKTANDEWTAIKSWVDKRLETLAKAESLWDEFKARKIDLVDYLRDVENELNAASGLDLNDSATVEARAEAFKKVTAGMETRKYHVANLVEIADQLIDLISEESGPECSLANGIQSQVTDILDLWNSRVKRSIELKTVLQSSCKKFETLERLFGEVHIWVTNVNDTLNEFTVDARGEHIDEIRVLLEEKQSQEEEMKNKLDEVNAIDEELSKNGELSSQYSLEGSITELNEDFSAVSNQLEELRKFRGKARILSRRVRGGTRRLFTKGEREEQAAPQPIEAAS